MPETKTCPRCGETKDRATEFTHRKDGSVFSWCKACNSAYARERAAAKKTPAEPAKLSLAGAGYDAQQTATVGLLAAGRELTAKELADAIGVSPSRAGDVLVELVELGRATRSKVGRSYVYRAA